MERKYISVHSLNQYIKARFQQDVQLQNVYIKGEVSNYRPHPSGHLYFTLKDETSRVSAIMFASSAKKMKFHLENGMHVLVQARVAVYEVNGTYQLNVLRIDQDGIGNLYLAFQQLKDKLEKEGLFDQKYKKEIPRFPHSIAVLSAKQGSAVMDVIRTIHNRAPFVNVVVFPIPVQGENAFITISKVLKEVDRIGFDTIILARGGGSIEDLINFNSELLARTIFDLKTPLISGIGHETDFTICDFVSDIRAVTPTGAAIIATPDCKELKRKIFDDKKKLISVMDKKIELEKRHLNYLTHSYILKNPEQLYANQLMKVSQLEDNLFSKIKLFEQRHQQNNTILIQRLIKAIHQKIDYQNYKLRIQIEKLDAFSPLKILSRGYHLVYKDNHMIKSINELEKNDQISIQMNDGQVLASVKQVKK